VHTAREGAAGLLLATEWAHPHRHCDVRSARRHLEPARWSAVVTVGKGGGLLGRPKKGCCHLWKLGILLVAARFEIARRAAEPRWSAGGLEPAHPSLPPCPHGRSLYSGRGRNLGPFLHLMRGLFIRSQAGALRRGHAHDEGQREPRPAAPASSELCACNGTNRGLRMDAAACVAHRALSLGSGACGALSRPCSCRARCRRSTGSASALRLVRVRVRDACYLLRPFPASHAPKTTRRCQR